MIITHSGELLAFRLTPGTVDDRKALINMAEGISGKLFADKGYLAPWLSESLAQQPVELITTLRKNMKPMARSLFDPALLSRRSLVETVFDELKNLCQIEHSRHRSMANFVVNLLSGLIAYCFMPIKPTLNLKIVNTLTSTS